MEPCVQSKTWLIASLVYHTRSQTKINKKCGRRVRPTRYAPARLYRYSILFPELRRGRAETYRRCELMTLTFNLGGHGACRWCGSTFSIRTPTSKFLGLKVRKIWCTMCVSNSALMGLAWRTEAGFTGSWFQRRGDAKTYATGHQITADERHDRLLSPFNCASLVGTRKWSLTADTDVTVYIHERLSVPSTDSAYISVSASDVSARAGRGPPRVWLTTPHSCSDVEQQRPTADLYTSPGQARSLAVE